MSEDTGVYIVAGGVVQQFPDKPVIRTNQVNNQSVSSFTIKAFGPQQALLSVSLWPEFAALVPHIVKGAFVSVEGKMRSETKNGVTFHNVSAYNIAVLTPVARAEREVVNAQPESQVQQEQAAPAAQGASTIF